MKQRPLTAQTPLRIKTRRCAQEDHLHGRADPGPGAKENSNWAGKSHFPDIAITNPLLLFLKELTLKDQ